MNKLEFETDQINIVFLGADCSASMEKEVYEMKKGLQEYKDKMIKFAKEEGMSIAICISKFNDSYYSGSFVEPDELDTRYYASGGTAMYDAIHYGAKQLDKYMQEVIKINKVKPRATFIIFSDGESNSDSLNNYVNMAKSDIAMLNELGVTTAFVAFGSSVKSELGTNLGFQSTIDVNDRSVLERFLGVELSKSTIEQSRSIHSLGSDFFSKATTGDEKSEKISNKSKVAIEDRKWLDNIFFN